MRYLLLAGESFYSECAEKGKCQQPKLFYGKVGMQALKLEGLQLGT